MPPLEIDVARHDEAWPSVLDSLAEHALQTALAESGATVGGPAEVSVLLTNDLEQQALNREWRGKDKPTNVLSFPQIAPFAPVTGLLGDIVLARETVVAEAEAEGKPFDHHFAHLIVHGFLHLLGYDHETEGDALAMESLETRILEKLGVPDPYASETQNDGVT